MNLSHVPRLHTMLRAQRDAKQTRSQKVNPWRTLVTIVPGVRLHLLHLCHPMAWQSFCLWFSLMATLSTSQKTWREETIAPGSSPQAVRVRHWCVDTGLFVPCVHPPREVRVLQSCRAPAGVHSTWPGWKPLPKVPSGSHVPSLSLLCPSAKSVFGCSLLRFVSALAPLRVTCVWGFSPLWIKYTQK